MKRRCSERRFNRRGSHNARNLLRSNTRTVRWRKNRSRMFEVHLLGSRIAYARKTKRRDWVLDVSAIWKRRGDRKGSGIVSEVLYMSLALVREVHSSVDWHLGDEQQSGSRQSTRPSKYRNTLDIVHLFKTTKMMDGDSPLSLSVRSWQLLSTVNWHSGPNQLAWQTHWFIRHSPCPLQRFGQASKN